MSEVRQLTLPTPFPAREEREPQRTTSYVSPYLEQGAAPEPAEVALVVTDLARTAERLVATADALVTAPAEARPALRATLYRWQTVLALGARRLAQAQ